MTFVVTRQRAQEVHDLARARAGLPYAYGGAFTRDPRRSTDCSGLVLQTAAWYGGRTDWPGNRYGSTESFRLDYKIVYDLGFKRMPPGGLAALPFKPVMLVGLQHGGGGVNSHTACTLMTMDIPGGPVKMSTRGVDWESRGGNPGVFLYDGARAWNDPLFHDFWYLDAKLEGADTRPPQPLGKKDQYALAVINEGRRLGVTPKGLKIALATTLVETNLTMYANRNVPDSLNYPHDAVGSDHDSTGLFQQRQAWGPLSHTMDPALSARLFFLGGQAGQRGLTDFPYNTNARTPGGWAQAVQVSAFPDRYDERYAEAEQIYNRLSAIEGDELTPEQDRMVREIHACLFNKVASQSLYADPGEGARWQLHELIKNQDGLGHEEFVEREALRGNPDELARVIRVAQGKGRVREDWAVARAQRVLKEIEAQNPSALEQYLSQRGQ